MNQVLQAQVSEQVEADRYERTENRKAYRNGSYPHGLYTRVGTTLSVPRILWREVHDRALSRYQRSEQALILAMMEMVVNGVSTRKVSQVTEELAEPSFLNPLFQTL
ncbi:transposase [Paenibacillus larvae]|nr:transposase [Paenibacillus larvae]MDT2240854.1 transposase [Paenibacillus larvae]